MTAGRMSSECVTLRASSIPDSHSYTMAQGLNKNIHFPILILTRRTTANIEGFKIRKGKEKTCLSGHRPSGYPSWRVFTQQTACVTVGSSPKHPPSSLPPLWFLLRSPCVLCPHFLPFHSSSALTGVPSVFTMVWTIVRIHFEDFG